MLFLHLVLLVLRPSMIFTSNKLSRIIVSTCILIKKSISEVTGLLRPINQLSRTPKLHSISAGFAWLISTNLTFIEIFRAKDRMKCLILLPSHRWHPHKCLTDLLATSDPPALSWRVRCNLLSTGHILGELMAVSVDATKNCKTEHMKCN